MAGINPALAALLTGLGVGGLGVGVAPPLPLPAPHPLAGPIAKAAWSLGPTTADGLAIELRMRVTALHAANVDVDRHRADLMAMVGQPCCWMTMGAGEQVVLLYGLTKYRPAAGSPSFSAGEYVFLGEPSDPASGQAFKVPGQTLALLGTVAANVIVPPPRRP